MSKEVRMRKEEERGKRGDERKTERNEGGKRKMRTERKGTILRMKEGRSKGGRDTKS